MDLNFKRIKWLAYKSRIDFGKELQIALEGVIKVSPFHIQEVKDCLSHFNMVLSENNLHIHGWKLLRKSLQLVSQTKDTKVISGSIQTEKATYFLFCNENWTEYFGLIKFKDWPLVVQNEIDEDGNLLDLYTQDFLFNNGVYIQNERYKYYDLKGIPYEFMPV